MCNVGDIGRAAQTHQGSKIPPRHPRFNAILVQQHPRTPTLPWWVPGESVCQVPALSCSSHGLTLTAAPASIWIILIHFKVENEGKLVSWHPVFF